MRKTIPNCYRSRHGVWYFRISIPKKFLTGSRRKEIRRSLQTTSHNEAVKKAAVWRVRCDTFFQSVMSDSYSDISEELEEKILQELEQEQPVIEWGMFGGGEEPKPQPTEQELRERERGKLEVRAIRIKHELEQERRHAIRREEAIRLEGEMGLPRGSLLTEEEKAAPVLVSAAYAEYMEAVLEADQHMKKRGMNRFKSSIRFFIGLMGDMPLNRLTPQIGAEFYQLMLKSAADIFTRKRIHKDAPIYETHPKELFFSCTGERVKHEAAKEKLAELDKFITWAFSHYGLTKGFDSLSDSILTPKKYGVRKSNTKRKALTDEQTEMLLNFKDVKRFKEHESNSQRFWMPAIMAYTGCRNAEAIWLTVNGIYQDDESGIYCFRFCDEIVKVKGKDVLLRNVKASNSNRSVPIHSQLLEWGIIRHWQRAKSNKDQTYIFNNRLPGMDDTVSNDQSEKVSAALKELGIYEKDTVVAYSLRHRFINRISQLGLNERQVGYFVGHVDQDDEAALANTTATYYLKDGSIRDMQSVIEKLPIISLNVENE